eukprot:1262957-Amorphochlora_amoeboformis.AAC.1
MVRRIQSQNTRSIQFFQPQAPPQAYLPANLANADNNKGRGDWCRVIDKLHGVIGMPGGEVRDILKTLELPSLSSVSLSLVTIVSSEAPPIDANHEVFLGGAATRRESRRGPFRAIKERL